MIATIKTRCFALLSDDGSGIPKTKAFGIGEEYPVIHTAATMVVIDTGDGLNAIVDRGNVTLRKSCNCGHSPEPCETHGKKRRYSPMDKFIAAQGDRT